MIEREKTIERREEKARDRVRKYRDRNIDIEVKRHTERERKRSLVYLCITELSNYVPLIISITNVR